MTVDVADAALRLAAFQHRKLLSDAKPYLTSDNVPFVPSDRVPGAGSTGLEG